MPNNNRKLHILISCLSASWGGLEMASLETAVELKKSGHNITVSGLDNSILLKNARKNELNILSLKPGNSGILKNIFTLNKFLKRAKPDIVHTHLSHDLWILTPSLKITGSKAKLFLTKHMASGVKKTDILHRYLYRRIDKAIAVSSYIKKSLINTTILDEDSITVIPVGIEKEKFSKSNYNSGEISDGLHIPPGKLIIGFTGRITPGKGHEEFFEACKILNEKYPGKLYYVIVGSAGTGEEEYENFIKQIPVKLGIQNIIFTGYTDEPQKYMSIFDILVFPSRDESFGRVLVEAMAMEIPTASSGFGGVLDITVENETGLLFKPKDPESMADALGRLLADKKLREKFSENGKKRFEELFTSEAVTGKLINLYLNT